MKRALCFGINNYPDPGNRLSECVNDARDWAKKLRDEFGFVAEIYLDAMVTVAEFKRLVSREIGLATAGDWLVIQYSGHGTYGVDMSGDEEDGYDEALYLYDGVLYDDEIRELLQDVMVGVHVVVILDSCFSGTATRKPAGGQKGRPRFVMPFVMPKNLPKVLRLRKRFLSQESMIEVLISGCSDKEYCYDAPELGNGAFSDYALRALRPGQTFVDFYRELRKSLPSSEYPQTPQLEGKAVNLSQMMFETPTPVPNPEPDPADDPLQEVPDRWWCSGWFVIAVALAVAAIVLYTLLR